MKTNLMALGLIVIVITACGNPITLPIEEQTSSPTIVILSAETPLPDVPTATSISLVTQQSSPIPAPLANSSIRRSERIIYYFFVDVEDYPYPQGSVVVMKDTYILAPIRSEVTSSNDTAADLRQALQAALYDSRNGWESGDLEIVDVTFEEGHAAITLQGDYFGVGDITLITARMQILMTVFANPSVQTTTVTLNGDTIDNLGVSNSMYASPADYVFTRFDIETYMTENAYESP